MIASIGIKSVVRDSDGLTEKAPKKIGTAQTEKGELRMVKKFDSSEICNLLENLIGETEPVADSAADRKIEQNVMTVIDVLDWCLDGLYMAAKHRHSEYDSERSVGERAYAVLDEIETWCKGKVEELG